jgi:hypothetical protein
MEDRAQELCQRLQVGRSLSEGADDYAENFRSRLIAAASPWRRVLTLPRMQRQDAPMTLAPTDAAAAGKALRLCFADDELRLQG